MDDTIVRKRGRKVHGTGWKRDPLGPHFCTNFVWAQRFLQMSAALPDSECQGRARAIPVDFVHVPSPSKPRKKAPPEAWREYRLKQEECRVGKVAVESLRQLREQVKERKIIFEVKHLRICFSQEARQTPRCCQDRNGKSRDPMNEPRRK